MLQSDPNSHSKSLVFARELARFGPHPHSSVPVQDALQYCRRWAKGQYENFTVVSWMLPRSLRQDFCNIYAYCRWSDNLADEVADKTESRMLLDWWGEQLQSCYTGAPVHPIMIALQLTIRKHDLPMEPLANLLSAFRQDCALNRYEDEGELLDYCRRSANPVGRILLHMAQVTDGLALELSDRICTALQLANFCQDVARDAALGRIYAPRSLWLPHGVTEELLLNQRSTPELQSMLRSWVNLAGNQFVAGWPLVHMVPGWLRTDVDLFVRGGLQILRQIDAAGYDVWTQRPTVSKWTKGKLLASSLLGRATGYHPPSPHWLEAPAHG